ncbi:MAG: hypothetical protein KO206_00675 [Methanomicrobiaceae archaeon]|nr:hypothetical protein [Methanomicrobiaceae archaeon]
MERGMGDSKISSVLAEMGLSEDSIHAINGLLDGFSQKVMNGLPEARIKCTFNAIRYTYAAQHIREEGVIYKNIPDDAIHSLKVLEFIENAQWHSFEELTGYVLTEKGNAIAEVFARSAIEHLEPRDFEGHNPLAVLYVIDKKRIEASFLQKSPRDYNYATALPHEISRTFFNDCIQVLETLVAKKLAAVVDYYLTPRGGGMDERFYLVAPCLRQEDVVKFFTAVDYSAFMESFYRIRSRLAGLAANIGSLEKIRQAYRSGNDFSQYHNTSSEEGIVRALKELEQDGSIILKDEVRSGRLCDRPIYVADERTFLHQIQELIRDSEAEIRRLLASIERLPETKGITVLKLPRGGVSPDAVSSEAPSASERGSREDEIILCSKCMPHGYGVIAREDDEEALSE